MALKKTVIMPNGLPLEYHRVVFVSLNNDNQNMILVHSYLNEEARRCEKDYEAGLVEDISERPYVYTRYYNTECYGAMSVGRAYDWLKTNVPEFEGAEDTGDQSDEITGDDFVSMLEEVL